MADDGSQQRKPDFQSVLGDVKALATVLVMELESVLGRRLHLRSPAVLAAIGVIATLVLALLVVMALLQTGEANAVSDNAALIGALIALGGVFTAQMVSIALDDRRTHEARDLEAQRAGEAALQTYFENVGELLIEKPLRRASPGDNLSTVVRAQTLSVLAGLDPDRKRLLLLFLYESGLIYKDKPVVSLAAADLRGAKLRGAKLRGANLSKASLHKADLGGVDLRGANLSEANLSETYLRDAILTWAILNRSDLRTAYLSTAKLIETDLSEANLSGANLRSADLRSADLSGANLSGAILRRANLLKAGLFEADLSEADLSEADLKGANMQGATGVPSRELKQQAYSLAGAIMPDGSKHP